MTNKDIEKAKNTIDELTIKLKVALEENEKLKEEIKLMEKERVVNQNSIVECNKIISRLKSQISPVEVLEWLNEHSGTQAMMNVTGQPYDTSWIFSKYTPQTIVDKIATYERGKDNNVSANSNSDVGTKTGTKTGSKKFEFHVGDWVKHCEFGLGRIYAVYADGVDLDVIPEGENFGQIWHTENCEHAEPPKEEPLVEWVWECEARWIDNEGINCGCSQEVISEEQAMKWCEYETMESYRGKVEASYKKVCRRKE